MAYHNFFFNDKHDIIILNNLYNHERKMFLLMNLHNILLNILRFEHC